MMEAALAAKPLAGRVVAVTRAREQAAGLVERLRDLGAEVIESPAITIAELEDLTRLDEAICRLGEYNWVIFTSANGVSAFTARMERVGVGIEQLSSRRLGAIGPTTAAALERAGCTPAFVPDTYVAEAVVDQIDDVQGSRVLLPRADIARKALADGLRAKGAVVDEVSVYRTLPGEGSERLADMLAAGVVDAITFTSSSTVRYTLENLERGGLAHQEAVDMLKRARSVCIGPVTAETARQHGLRIARIADEYTVDGLVAALVALLGESRNEDGGQHAGGQ